MVKQTSKNEKQSKSATSSSSIDLNSIIKGLENYSNKIADSLKSRIGPGNWQFWKSNFKLEEDEESIDLIFCSNDKKKTRYILIDISVPHLQIGQKYLLPAKAKLFHKQHKVPLNRIKKAIILVRKGTETVSTRPSRIRCPIIEVQLSRIMPDSRKKRSERPSSNRDNRDKRDKRDNRDKRPESKKQFNQVVSKDLLYALKEAIVHECLSTMHKRRNKYIRKGLWRWIEREIMDPNVHFYLIILSTIYQGKTGEVLSRKFKKVEDFSQKPEEVISAIFTRETNLADEIKKNSARHKKALNKFLACFSQTPPFEYLKSLFLKEFRSNQDGLKARLSVFTTLNQLLERCGFEGEKETQYPLEILDELGIFQGIMAGNYAKLRIINASKKLKHLVPQVEWTEEDIYQLRNQLAKALNLPAQEFNLNAFLPQAFVQDAKVLAEARKEAFRAPANDSQKTRRSDNRHNQDNADRTRKKAEYQNEVKDSATAEKQDKQSEVQNTTAPEPAPLRREKRKPNECDESKHRHFESFGGQTEEDLDSVRLALAMSRYESEKREAKKKAELEPKRPEEEFLEDPNHIPPIKSNKHDLYNYNPPPPKKKKSSNNRNNNNNSRGNTRRKPGRTSNKRRRRPNPNKNNSSGSSR
ncbi:MAG: hypothetical protein ACQETH_04500 [Candidatus Rifleibacteriota bacterium]